MGIATHLTEEELDVLHLNKSTVEKIGRAKYRMTDKDDKKKSYDLRNKRKNRHNYAVEED